MVLNVILAILVLSIIVIVHEFGHFIIAKANGITVVEFSIGFGPKLIHFRKGETEYCIKALPFGGACTMLGDEFLEMSVIQSEDDDEELTDEEKAAFIEDLGIGQSGLDKLVQKSYELLGLISFLTAGTDEVRAWTITRGTKAPGAAGKIHTDFERGFIRAEVVPYETLIEQGSMAACKEKGLVRSEGKDYVVQDGDIIVFRFNV